MKRALWCPVVALLAVALLGPGTAGAESSPWKSTSAIPAAAATERSTAIAPAAESSVAAATITPATAVARATAHAAADGATAYVSVVSRTSGAVLAQSGNAGAQVGSESIVKLMIASYYLVLYGGYTQTPSSVRDELSYMLRYSDDATASSLFTANAVPTIAARYGMGSTINATDRPGHWGAARITAHDMAHFLYEASEDSEVGPWLIPVMSQTAPNGSDGFDQHFGMNALGGVHGSKQGWGCDSYFTAQSCAIHSVGYTDKYFVAVLQTSNSYPDPMRGNATYAAQQIQASSTVVIPPPPPAPKPIKDGDFVLDTPTGEVYRIVGGAPVYVPSWREWGNRPQPVRRLTAAQFNALPQHPRSGVYVLAGHDYYVLAGGAPILVSNHASVGGVINPIRVDPRDITGAGTGGHWNRLQFFPTTGTLLQAGREIYLVVGGAPVYVSNYAAIGGPRPAVKVDPLAIDNAGTGGGWNHLRAKPIDGTLLQIGTQIYIVAGGAPMYVSNWAAIGGRRTATKIDPAAITNAARGGHWNHLRFRPADGTLLLSSHEVYIVTGGAPLFVTTYAHIGGPRPLSRVDPAAIVNAGQGGHWTHLYTHPASGTFVFAGHTTYRVAGGALLYIPSWTPFGGPKPTVHIDDAALTHAGEPGRWKFLLRVPANGTLLRGLPGGRTYRVVSGIAHRGTYTGTFVDVSQEAIDRLL